MLVLTKEQQKALVRIYNRTDKTSSYRQFRKACQPGWGCVMIPYAGMWLGIEPDGYTHS